MSEIKFTKMHGTGNDFVVIDCITQNIGNRSELSKEMCRRKFGVGADQFILICPSEEGDYCMEIYNPDGSNVEMCGNALRAVALYVKKYLNDDRELIRIETLGGMTEAVVHDELVTVNMGPPSFEAADIGLSNNKPLINEEFKFSDTLSRTISCVSMGNPHCVQVVNDTTSCPLESEGPIIENHSLFQNRTNVEFIEIISREEVTMRVWERGTGETLACGSGACAVGAAVMKSNMTDRTININLKGGQLTIEWRESDNCIYMTGPATFVFDGVWER